MKQNKNKQSKLFPELENNDWQEEWKEMPEYVQKNLIPYRKLIINFETKEDFEEFIKLLKLEDVITDKTKYIWFPIQEKELPKNFGYIFDNEEKTKK